MVVHTVAVPQLDPQIQAVLDAMAAQPQPAVPPSLDEVRAGAAAGHRALCPPPVEMAGIETIAVPGPNGDVTCLVNTPRDSDAPLPVLVYFHGGGLMLFEAEDFQPVCTALAAAAGCIVVNVDYRRTTEHPFPQPLDDAFAVYQWCLAHADEIGGDPTRIAVGGDSAGGYLAAAVCLDAKRLGAPQPIHQMLVYPDIDMANRSESMMTIDAFIGVGQITELHVAHCGDDLTNPRASPIHADDHTGLAPAFILLADHDPFYDQGRAYAAVLRAAGVPMTSSCYEGTIHAFFTMGGAVDIANVAVAEAASNLANAFAR
jgi:acetyl esterase